MKKFPKVEIKISFKYNRVGMTSFMQMGLGKNIRILHK
jgi:hypothetical protein